MNQEQIIAGNKLIAEFMKVKFSETDFTDDVTFGGNADAVRYHRDWSWLMPVVEKIKDIDNQAGITDMALLNIFKKEHEGEGDNIFETSIFCPIGEVYNRVIVFINWFND